MIRFASLGSGSAGNGLVVESGETRLLVDCGFGLRDTEVRLGRLGLKPADITGLLVTHEHSDHIGGVFRFARHHGLPVWLTYGTLAAAGGTAPEVDCRSIDSHDAFLIGDLEVFPFPVPHDAREPVQYVFSDGERRLGLLTDAGGITDYMCRMLAACDALVLECNHDRLLLAESRYPASLKRRIGGRFGHLSNDVAAQLLARVASDRLQHVVAAHLSEQNNRPELASAALAAVLGCALDWIGVAAQESGFDWRRIV